MNVFRVAFLLAGVTAFAGCAIQRAVVAQGAQDKMVGMSREQILACMGPPRYKGSRRNDRGLVVWIGQRPDDDNWDGFCSN